MFIASLQGGEDCLIFLIMHALIKCKGWKLKKREKTDGQTNKLDRKEGITNTGTK